MTTHSSSVALAVHYSLALGLVRPWTVTAVDLDTLARTLTIDITYEDDGAPCPVCAAPCRLHDVREARVWRHLDMMQFQTTIRSRVPRASCAEHGVKSLPTPWAGAHSRFTLLFEHFAVEVLQNAASVSGAKRILGLSWDQLHLIQRRAVERGMARREEETIRYVGIDEKSFLKGHRYASLLTDLDRGRVLEVVQDRTKEAAKTLINTALTDVQRTKVEAAAMDMWPAFMDEWRAASSAPVVHDRFHIAKYLGEAVDAVRRKENRVLLKEGDETLKGARYLFLKNELDQEEKVRFRSLMKDELQVGRAWTLKEAFRHFWDFVRESAAASFFTRWYFHATHSRLAPLIKVAKMLKRHLAGLLAHCAHDITNAVTEGLNSKIQAVKASARGFRNFANYRVAILFHCGKLDMAPRSLHSNA